MPNPNEPGHPRPAGGKGGGKWTRYQGSACPGGADWGACTPQLISSAVVAVALAGDALLFSTTRDGGALVITICSGDKRLKLYAPSGSMMDTHLYNIIADATT